MAAPAEPPRSATGGGWWQTAALAVLAALHLAWFAGAGVERARQLPDRMRRFDPTRPPDRSQIEAEVARLLPRLLRKVPEDATVVVFTALAQLFPFQLHTAPRRTLLQQVFKDELLAYQMSRGGKDAWKVEERYRQLEERGYRYTPERLARALEESDYLLTFFAEGEADPRRGPLAERLRLEPAVVVRNAKGQSVGLYRVVRP